MSMQVKRGVFVKVSTSRSYAWEDIHHFDVVCGGSLEKYRESEFFNKLVSGSRHEEVTRDGEEYIVTTYRAVKDVEYVEVDGVLYLYEGWLSD